MLVLHRAKLLASNQSVLALGVAPRRVAGTPVPVFTPFPGKGGRGIGIINQKLISKTDFFYKLKYGCFTRQPYFRLSINLYNFWKWGLGRSPKRGEGGSPTLSPARTPGVYAQRLCTMQSQPSIHSLSRGKGVFGKDAEIRTHQALHEAKPTECPKGDRDWEQALFWKNILFLQAEVPGLFINRGLNSIYQILFNDISVNLQKEV